MLVPVGLRGGVLRFLADRNFAVLTGRDSAGHRWISPLSGTPGFLHSGVPSTLDIDAAPAVGDPLSGIEPGQPVGVVVVEFATRRRVRINGTLTSVGPHRLSIEVDQAYGNCPQYIQQRVLNPAAVTTRIDDPQVRRGHRLQAADIALIRGADTFFIGSGHPVRGADASHRGGPAGFVRVGNGELWWPDYRGNNMFNTLGNLAVDPTAALLFPDFSTGRTLQLSGTATTEWTTPGRPGDDDATGRIVHFTVDHLVAGHLLSLHAQAAISYHANPVLSSSTS
jgi:predicted pyridoxine 5'-phosphate oxidase superfamily flavin-nucleotide-binding protein